MTIDETARETSMDTTEQIAVKQGEAEADGSAPVVAVEDLHKSFGSQKVLTGISLTVRRGETLACWGAVVPVRAYC